MLELCLYTIKCVENIDNSAPAEMDPSLTPLLFSEYCPCLPQLLSDIKVNHRFISKYSKKKFFFF